MIMKVSSITSFLAVTAITAFTSSLTPFVSADKHDVDSISNNDKNDAGGNLRGSVQRKLEPALPPIPDCNLRFIGGYQEFTVITDNTSGRYEETVRGVPGDVYAIPAEDSIDGLRAVIVLGINGGPMAIESRNDRLFFRPVEGYAVVDDGTYGRDLHHLMAQMA